MSRPGSIHAVEELARLRKAIALADVLSASGIAVADIMGCGCASPEHFWSIACEGAQFAADYRPSQETRVLTLQLLAAREDTCRRLMAMKEKECKVK